MTTKAQLDFTSPESARDMGNTVDGFRKLISSLSSDQNTRRLMDQAQVTVVGPRLTILVEAPVADLKAVIAGLERGPMGLTPKPTK